MNTGSSYIPVGEVPLTYNIKYYNIILSCIPLNDAVSTHQDYAIWSIKAPDSNRIHPEDPTATKTGTVKTTNNKTDTEAIKMELIITNKELTKQEIYFLTKAQDVMKMKDAVDSTVELAAWAIYTDTNADGQEVELFSMRTVDGETYATNSETFIRAFRDILDIFAPEEITKLKIMSGTSKNNRQFVTCAYTE